MGLDKPVERIKYHSTTYSQGVKFILYHPYKRTYYMADRAMVQVKWIKPGLTTKSKNGMVFKWWNHHELFDREPLPLCANCCAVCTSSRGCWVRFVKIVDKNSPRPHRTCGRTSRQSCRVTSVNVEKLKSAPVNGREKWLCEAKTQQSVLWDYTCQVRNT